MSCRWLVVLLGSLLFTNLPLWADEEVEDPSVKERVTPDLKSGPVPEKFRRVTTAFETSIPVFGVHVLAVKGFDAARHRHVAAVLAEYLDNDEDGKADNPKVVESMASRSMAMVLFKSERDMERLDRSGMEAYDFRYLQGQFQSETLPKDEFDATLEEVLHLVTMGYAETYPRIFGTLPGTALSECLDRARGGHFARVPRKYPEEAWFHYDDRSCEYGCMGVEYLYWGLTSLLGAQADPRRGRQIAHEWQLNTPKLMHERDPWLTTLLTDPRYRWASRLPDGEYAPAPNK